MSKESSPSLVVPVVSALPRGMRRFVFACLAMIPLAGCFGEPPMSLDELKTESFKVEIDGVAFDVPVLYHHNAYDKKRDRWPMPSSAEKAGLRRTVDNLEFMALLPNMEPYNEANAHLYDEPGHGRKVRVSLFRTKGDFVYYFNNTFPDLVPADDGTSPPGFQRYEDRSSGKTSRITYLNYDKPHPGLVLIRCDRPGSSVSPGCTVTAPYLDRFQTRYFFGLSHLPEWPAIHAKLIALVDQFRKAAEAR